MSDKGTDMKEENGVHGKMGEVGGKRKRRLQKGTGGGCG